MKRNRWLLIGLSSLLLSSSLTGCGYTIKIDKKAEETEEQVDKGSEKRIVKKNYEEESLGEEEAIETEETNSSNLSFGLLDETKEEVESTSEVIEEINNSIGSKSGVKQYYGMELEVPGKYEFVTGGITDKGCNNLFTYMDDTGENGAILAFAGVDINEAMADLDDSFDPSELDLKDPEVLNSFYEDYVSNFTGIDGLDTSTSNVLSKNIGGLDWVVVETKDIKVDGSDSTFSMIFGITFTKEYMKVGLYLETGMEDKDIFYDILSTMNVNMRDSEEKGISDDIKEVPAETETSNGDIDNKVSSVDNLQFTINGVALTLENSTLEDVYKAVKGDEPDKVDNYGGDSYYISFQKEHSNYLQVVTKGKEKDSKVKGLVIYYSYYDEDEDYEVAEFKKGMTMKEIESIYGKPTKDSGDYATWEFNDGKFDMTVFVNKDGQIWEVELTSHIYE